MRATAPLITKSLAAIVALTCLSTGGFLAGHYPLSSAFMLGAFAVACVAVFLRPEIWLFALPAILPAIGLASWTGWLAVEEFDIFVLAAAAGGYAALVLGRLPTTQHEWAAGGPSAPDVGRRAGLSGTARVLIALFALSIVVGSYRGIVGDGQAKSVPAVATTVHK